MSRQSEMLVFVRQRKRLSLGAVARHVSAVVRPSLHLRQRQLAQQASPRSICRYTKRRPPSLRAAKPRAICCRRRADYALERHAECLESGQRSFATIPLLRSRPTDGNSSLQREDRRMLLLAVNLILNGYLILGPATQHRATRHG